MMRRREFIADSLRSSTILTGIGTVCSALCACTRSPNSAPKVPGIGPPRLAALSPALAITLRDLGLTESIVARHAWDMALDISLPIAGDQSSLDYEALITTRPTHVLLEWGERPVPDRLLRLATTHDWKVRSWSLLSYTQVRSSLAEIAGFIASDMPTAQSLALSSRAEELASRLDLACGRREASARAGRVLLLHSVLPPAALGPGSFHHEILERLGGIPALTTGNPYVQLHMEDLLDIAPDAIVLIQPRDPRETASEPAPSTWIEIEQRLGAISRLSIPAVRERRVAIISDPFSLTPSTAMIGFAEEFASILARWA
ncbi:MAG: ABC transporter substrate-binding protein [Phycisphaeraceae bacterium]|nr:MAG: ABC transporter substrate-binding protein [Phycisphaeraceae bacterium]